MLARETAGPGHHLKAVQLPFNLAMPEAWILANQRHGANTVPFLGLAASLDIVVIASASLLQARLAGTLPSFILDQLPQFKKSAQCALQFARSVPGIVTALVGMKNVMHVRENLEVAKFPPLAESELYTMFQKAQR